MNCLNCDSFILKNKYCNKRCSSTYNTKVRQIARKNYLKSDRPKECVNCGYKIHFEVCHIKAVKDFNEKTTLNEINELDNLIALCRNCHYELDVGLLTIDELFHKM